MDTTYLTDENLDDLTVTAGYGSIDYWAGEAPGEVRAQAYEEDTDAFMVFIDNESGDGEVVVVTKTALRKAYFDLLSLDQQHVNREIHGYFIDSWRDRSRESGVNMGRIDATAADVWVQVAAFGEVVYG